MATEKTLAGQPPVAVIDVGTTAIRMAVAQPEADGTMRSLDVLNQPVSLGEDTFRRGAIRKSTIEDCARVLKSYRQILAEYGVRVPEDVRAIATSAVREASNSQMFIDRLYIATGIRIEAIDEAEVNRLTYLSIQPFFAAHPTLNTGSTLIVEVGAGTTEILLVQDGDVVSSHSYRLGSLRLQEFIEAYQSPAGKTGDLIGKQIQRTVDQIRVSLKGSKIDRIVGLGGDIRFAADRLSPGWRDAGVAKPALSALEPFARDLLNSSVDDLVRTYQVPYQDADSLGPALYAYARVARAFKRREIWVSTATLRDGLLTELSSGGAWTQNFREQIVRSAMELGRKYDFHEGHARHVADLSLTLYRALQDEHQLDPRHEDLLYTAALLHEVGLYVSNRSHHKHSMYLVMNSDLFGLGRKDLLLVALIARYHRRAQPKPSHLGYLTLDPESRVVVSKLAAILRVADALERSHTQRIKDIRCVREEDRFVIEAPRAGDLSLEQLALRQKGSMFEDIFGLKVHLRRRSRRSR